MHGGVPTALMGKEKEKRAWLSLRRGVDMGRSVIDAFYRSRSACASAATFRQHHGRPKPLAIVLRRSAKALHQGERVPD